MVAEAPPELDSLVRREVAAAGIEATSTRLAKSSTRLGACVENEHSGQGRDAFLEAAKPALQLDASRKNLFAVIAELHEAHAIAFELVSNPAVVDIFIDVPDCECAETHEPAPAPSKVRLRCTAPNLIRAHFEQLAAAAGTPLDRMKIDTVAMLFDHILADDQLPANITMLLARMQLPVLRVALGDESFFTEQAHPTRRLVDRLASCAVGWRGESLGDRKFLAEFERVVQEIGEDTNDDSALYERLLGEVDVFLDRLRSESELERAEQREVLVIKATIEINQTLSGFDVDSFLRAFLLDVWSCVLVETACLAEDPKTDAALARAKRLCLDLVWSAAPKTTAHERKRLVDLLPEMIAAMRRGLVLIGYPDQQKTRFFAELMKIHAAAIRPVASAVTARPGRKAQSRSTILPSR